MDINLMALNVVNSRLAIGVFLAGELQFSTRVALQQRCDRQRREIVGHARSRIECAREQRVIDAVRRHERARIERALLAGERVVDREHGIDLREQRIDPELFRSIPAELMFRYNFVPLESHDTSLVVAMADPSQLQQADELSLLLGKRLQIKVATASQIGDLLKRAASRFPDRIALTDGARQVTFSELERDANRFANYLVARGLKPGEKVNPHNVQLMQFQENNQE